MNSWLRHSVNVGALAAGALLVTGGAAQAEPAMISTGNSGTASGVQAYLPIQAPLNLCGNAIAVAGSAVAGCEGGAAAIDKEWSYSHYRESAPTMISAGNDGVASGLQAYAPIQLPVNICGNAISVLGTAAAGCDGGAVAERERDQRPPKRDKKHKKKPRYYYESSEADRQAYGQPEGRRGGGHAADDLRLISVGNQGALSGTQVYAPIQLPVNICGNAIAVLGNAFAGCDGGAAAISQRR
ncbi:MAG TPA: chaplin family protein [Natronosporangium sp.]|nr:chaplin family protein [Natronosporangium sp.]